MAKPKRAGKWVGEIANGTRGKRDLHMWLPCNHCKLPKWTDKYKNHDGFAPLCNKCVRLTGGKPTRKPYDRVTRPTGYVDVYLPYGDELYPEGGKISEHRLVMSKHLGRQLSNDEHVHHINNIKHDNRVSNLEIWLGSHPTGQKAEDFVVEYLRNMSQQDRDRIMSLV